VESIVFPNEEHSLVRKDRYLKFYAAAEVFLAECLGSRSSFLRMKKTVTDY
jgi:hypothetical protein